MWIQLDSSGCAPLEECTVQYKKGKLMHLTDTLRHAYLSDTQCCNMEVKCADIDHTSTLALPLYDAMSV